MGTKEGKSNEYSKNKIPIGRPFVEHLADIVICFYLHNPMGKNKQEIWFYRALELTTKTYPILSAKLVNSKVMPCCLWQDAKWDGCCLQE